MWHHENKVREKLGQQVEREGLRFEQWLVTLATGTLVLSVTFLKDLVPSPDLRWLLIASWTLLTLSILAGLADRLFYIIGLSYHPLLEGNGNGERSTRYWRWAELASWLQVLAFGLGIITLLVFAIQNVS